MPPPVPPPPGFQLRTAPRSPPAPPPGFALTSAAPIAAPAAAAPLEQPIAAVPERANLAGIDPAIYARATDFGRTVYDSAISGPNYDESWLTTQLNQRPGPPQPPPGFELTKPAGWVDVEPEAPIGTGEVLLDSLGQTADEWGDVFAGLPGKVSASLAKTVASMHASELAELEQAARAGVTLASPQARAETPDVTAARLGDLVDEELAIADEASQDLRPAEGLNFAQRGLESAATSAAPSAAALAAGLLTRNPALAAATMYPTTAAQSFGDLANTYDAQAEEQETFGAAPRSPEQRSADFARARHHSRVQGALEVGTELLPMGALLKKGTPAVQRLAEVLLAELPGETLATLTQAIDEQLATSPEGDELDDVIGGLIAGGKQIPETLVASILGSAGQAAPIAAAQALTPGQPAPATPPRIEPTLGDEAEVDEPVAARAPDAPLEIPGEAGPQVGDELEAARAPEARTPSEAWRADPSAGEGVPFAFLGETPEESAGYLVEENGKISAVTAAGDVVGEFDSTDQAAIALEDALGVQTPAPVGGQGEEITELGGAPVPKEATPGQVVERGLGDELGENPVETAALNGLGDEIEGGAATPGRPEPAIAAPDAPQAVQPQTQRIPVVAEERERRANRDQPKRVADMTPDELRQSLLTHELTGIPNRRAYEEAPKLASQTAVDVDSLKWINDNMGHDSGNELLKAVGEAIRAETDQAYHLSGDEFAVQAATDEEAAELMQRVNDRLAGAVISVTMPSGEVVTVSGLGVSYGSGKDLSAADARLQAHKTEREARGERAGRGQQPPGASRFATEEGGQDHEDLAPAGEAEAAADEGRGSGARGAAPQVDPATGERITLAGPFAHSEREDVDEVELAERPSIEQWKREQGNRTQAREVKIRQLLGKAKNAPEFRFVPEGSLPHSIQSRMRVSPGHEWEGAFDPSSNKVYLNQDALDSEERAAWVAMHEIAGHYGLRGAIGQMGEDNRDKLDAALELASQNPYIASLAEKIRSKRRALSLSQSIEEALAELAAGVRTGNLARLETKYGIELPEVFTGRNAKKPAWLRALDRFVDWLEKLLFKTTGARYTDEQVRELIEGAWRYVQEGKKPPKRAKFGDEVIHDIDLEDDKREINELLELSDRTDLTTVKTADLEASIEKLQARQKRLKPGTPEREEIDETIAPLLAEMQRRAAEKTVAGDDGPQLSEAYHGSPHKFDKFSLEHIGTGEGAQAWGWGLYFAETKGVAEQYHGNLAQRTWYGANGEKIARGGDRWADAVALEYASDDQNKLPDEPTPQQMKKYLEQAAESLDRHAGFAHNTYGKETAAMYLDAARRIRVLAGEGITLKRGGGTYTVELDDKAVANMIDYDSPSLDDQAPGVQKALRAIEKAIGIEFEWDRSGRSAYARVGNVMNRDADVTAAVEREVGKSSDGAFNESVSLLFAKFGIPGGTYSEGKGREDVLNAMSEIRVRGGRAKALEHWKAKLAKAEAGDVNESAEAATRIIQGLERNFPRNIVVFDDSIVTIKEINGKPVTPKESAAIVARGSPEQLELLPGAQGKKVEKRDRRAPATGNKAQKDLFAQQLELDEQVERAHVADRAAFQRWFKGSKVVDESGEPLVVYHGTVAEQDFAKFDVTEDIGFHFGTALAANDVTDSHTATYYGDPTSEIPARIIPAYLAIKKPLRLPDLEDWAPPELLSQLEDLGVITEQEREDTGHDEVTAEWIREKLEAKGYDGIVYRNQTEGLQRDRRVSRYGLKAERSPDWWTEQHPAEIWAVRADDGRLAGTGKTRAEAMADAKAKIKAGKFERTEDSWIALRPEQIKSAIGNRGTFDPEAGEIHLSEEEKPQSSKTPKSGFTGAPGQRYVKMYREKGAPTHATRAEVRAEELQIPKEPIRAQHVMQLFQRLFKVKIYEGKPFRVRNALGYFVPKTFEVRNKYRNDLEVAAHEVFHWLDRTYPTIRKLYHLRRYHDELMGVSYDDTKIYEGFAEFGRLFMTQEAEAIERLPTFYEAFVKEARDAGILDKLEEVQKLMHQWYLQGAEARGRSKIGTSKAPIRQRLGAMADGFVDRAIASHLDSLQAAKVIERETTGGINEDAARSPYKSMRLLAGARSTINAWLNYGTQKWTDEGDLEYNGMSLREIFEPVAGVFDEAMGYFVAARANELRRYGKENLLQPDEIKALVERAKKTGKLPQIQEAHRHYQAFTKRLTAFAVQSGILSAETKAVWEAMYENYVPFYRVAEKFGSLDPRMVGGTRGGLFRKLTGGTANIADVFENITLNTALIVHASLKNVAKRQLFAAIVSSPIGQRYAVKIPAGVEVRKVAMEQIERVLRQFSAEATKQGRNGVADKIEAAELAQLSAALGARSNDLGQMTMTDIQAQATFFFTGQPPSIPDKEQVLVRGKPVWFQIGDPMLWDMLVHTNYHQPLGLTEQLLGVAKRTLTRGVTVTPEFQFANILRDTFNAFAMSKGKQLPIVDALKAIVDIWKESPAYKDFLGNAGGFGNAIGDESKRVRVRMNAGAALRGALSGPKGAARAVLSTPAAVLEFWDKWGQSFELATRLAEYKKIRGQGKSRREAAYQGREISTDFAMRGHGQLARWASISLAFFNARLQGLYRIEREINEKRGRQTVLRGERALAYAARALTGITFPSLLVYWFINRGDDDYEELGEEIKSLNTVIRGPDGSQILIPRPFETGALFQEVPIRLLEYYEKRDGEKLVGAMMFMLANTFNFSPIPQLVAPPATLATNRQWNGLPVIPRNLQNVEPREQFQPWTPDTYKRVGAALDVSPLKLQALVEGYFGTIGGYAVAASDALMQAPDTTGAEPSTSLSRYPLIRRFMREQPYANTSFEQQFYDMLDETTRVVDTARKFRREGRVDELEDYLGEVEQATLFALSGPTTDVMEQAAEINADMRLIRNDPALSADEKAEQIRELQANQNALFKAAVQDFDEARLEEARRALGVQ
jgi:diguanylate cyclase (GGDEF)-like protein